LILVLSLILGILPLLGIVWIVMSGWLATVDGLFMTLILLTLSGILLLNAVFEVRARGLLKRKTAQPPPPPAAPAPKPQVQPAQAQTSQAQKAAQPAEAQTTPAQKTS
jgi:predicted lipid-binding transport protein (Tim44 family)